MSTPLVRELRRRQDLLHAGHGCPHNAGRDPGKVRIAGGPAESDLGFPTIDEGPGRVGPDSRNTTFSAADKPVIFWTPTTGARVVRGPINVAWDKLGGSAGPLGVPVEDEAYRGEVVTQKFTGGELSWNRQTKTFTTVPPELAGQLTVLEVPDGPTSAINAAAAPRAESRARWAPRRARRMDRLRRPRPGLRRRQDLLQSIHRGACRHRSGPREVRERRWSRG